MFHLPKQFVSSHSTARNRDRVTFKRKAATNTTGENERIHSTGILNTYTHKINEFNYKWRYHSSRD
jgi:hypothetical protein